TTRPERPKSSDEALKCQKHSRVLESEALGRTCEAFDRRAGPEGNPQRTTGRDAHAGRRQTLEGTQLHELRQEMKVLRGLPPRKPACLHVREHLHRGATAQGVIREGRARPSQAEKVVTPRKLHEL